MAGIAVSTVPAGWRLRTLTPTLGAVETRSQRGRGLNCWRMRAQLRRLLLIMLVGAGIGAPSVAADVPINPSALRGVWLERFTQFIDWPEDHRVNQKGAPFELCVLEDPDFADLLTTLYVKQSIKGKPVRIHKLGADSSLANCDMLFLGTVPPLTRDDILQRSANQPLLLVSATDGYGVAGSHINVYEEDGFLRFEINLDTIKAAGLTVSSRLLQIARVIRNKGGR